MRDTYQHSSYTGNHYGLVVHNQQLKLHNLYKMYLHGNVSMNIVNAKFKFMLKFLYLNIKILVDGLRCDRGQTHSDPAGKSVKMIKRREKSAKQSVTTSMATYSTTQKPQRGIMKA